MKPKKCKSCGTSFQPYRPLQSVCSPVCAVKLAGDKSWKERKSKLKESLISIGDLKKIARGVFQKWVRLRDKDLPCISCGTFTSEIWDAGHYFKAELFSGLIFDERNCHKQCRKCNTFLNGNEIQYRIGLVNRFGERWVKKLEKDSEKLRVKKYTKSELEDIQKKYSKKLFELKK